MFSAFDRLGGSLLVDGLAFDRWSPREVCCVTVNAATASSSRSCR